MTRFARVALTFILVIAVKVDRTDGKCRFPDFLQRPDPWAGDYKNGPLVAYVKPTHILVRESVNGGATHTFRKECVKRAPDNKFLVRLKEQGHRTKYQCMQFLKRSESIVQIKTSKRFDRQSMEICKEDGMRIDPYPLVQMNEGPNTSIACPFVGGYNIYAYYPHPNNTLVCANNLLLMRMESECERGGGIEFDFRKEFCVPKGLPRNPIQRARCLAHWTQETPDESYTFIVLQHAEQKEKYWCMRISDPLTDISMAYLWMQFVCDATSQPAPNISLNYLRLDFTRRILSSTCADELQVCQSSTHYCDINYKHHCALTCGNCLSEDQIGLCTFDEQYRGQWMDSGQNGDFIIDVTAYTVYSRMLGNYNCLNMEKDFLPDKRVLLEIYDNGCLPRYTCAEMSKVNSSVMKFRLGKRHPWPLPNVKKQKEYICKAENFQMHHRVESRYIKERPPRLIVNTKNNKEVHCGIPPHLQNGITFLEDGRRCGGCLHYDPLTSASEFIIRPVNCSDDTARPASSPASPEQDEPASLHNIPIRYNCLASFQFYNGSYSVITKTASFIGGLGQYLVWIFTRQNQIKVMKASETFVYQHNRHLKSEYILAQFSILRNDNLNCHVKTYPNRITTSTSTTSTTHTPTKPHYKTTSGPKGNNIKGGKYTYLPSNDTPYHENRDKVTSDIKTSNTQNLKGGNGSPSNRYSIELLFVTLMTSLAIWRLSSHMTPIT